jgi:hypothetical protein
MWSIRQQLLHDDARRLMLGTSSSSLLSHARTV